MTVIYTLIAKKIVTSYHKRRQKFGLHQKQALNRTFLKEEGLLAINSAIVASCFILCNMPLAISLLFDNGESHYIVVSIQTLNPMLDPIIYFLKSYFFEKKKKKHNFNTTLSNFEINELVR